MLELPSSVIVKKRDVTYAIAEILLRLGKGDYEGTRQSLARASEMFEVWMKTRPELHERALRYEKRISEDIGRHQKDN